MRGEGQVTVLHEVNWQEGLLTWHNGGMPACPASTRCLVLLHVQGLRILEYACDHAAEHTNTPLGMWALLEKEVQVCGGGGGSHMHLRRCTCMHPGVVRVAGGQQ